MTPPTAPARRSNFAGVRKADAAAGRSKPAAKAPEPAKAAGKQPPVQAGAGQPPERGVQPDKRPPGAADERPVFARNSSSPRPKRLITLADDEADWRSALAKTRAKRKAAAPGPQQGVPAPKPAPKPAPQPPSQPARPRRKRLPDDWLTGE